MSIGMKIDYRATDRVRAMISSLGRTEDVRFSRVIVDSPSRPSTEPRNLDLKSAGRRIAGAVVDGASRFHPRTVFPHGVDFLDDETIALPAATAASPSSSCRLRATIAARRFNTWCREADRSFTRPARFRCCTVKVFCELLICSTSPTM